MSTMWRDKPNFFFRDGHWQVVYVPRWSQDAWHLHYGKTLPGMTPDGLR